MAWTVPRTVVAGQVVDANIWNTDLRDNLLASEMAAVTAASQTISTTGLNAIVGRQVVWAKVDANESTTSATPVNLATVGPSVTVTTGGAALVLCTATVANNTAGGQATMLYSVTGATTQTTGWSILNLRAAAGGDQIRFSGLDFPTVNPGSNTFTAKYNNGGLGTATFVYRQIFVWPIG